MTTAHKTVLIAVLVVGGCGGAGQGAGEPLDTARGNQKHDVGHGKGHEGEGEMTLEVKMFHDALAPRWHAERGPQRMADTCAALPEFHGDVEAIAKALPPERANPTDWAASVRRLRDSITALDSPCKAKDAAQFEPAFAAVHDRFTALLGMSGEHHDKPEAH